jgi:purine nucleosidase
LPATCRSRGRRCNARIVAEICGRSDIPVYAGAEAPLKRKLVTAEHVHGKTGLDGVELFEPARPLEQDHAVDFIIETLRANPEKTVTLVPARTAHQHRHGD